MGDHLLLGLASRCHRRILCCSALDSSVAGLREAQVLLGDLGDVMFGVLFLEQRGRDEAKVRPVTLGVVFGKDWEAREVSEGDGLCLVIETSLFERVVHLVLPAKQGKLYGRSWSDEVSSLDKSFGIRNG